MSDNTVDFKAQAQLEREAFLNLKDKFTLENPAPQSPAESLLQSLSWEFWASILVGLAAMFLAGMRTYGKFLEISEKSFGVGNPAAYLEAGLAIVGIEGLMFLVDAIRASMGLSDVGKKSFIKQLEYVGWLTLAISVSAGLGQAVPALSLPPFVSSVTDWAILLGLGGGASYVAKISGGIVGHQVALAREYLASLTADYKAASADWNTRLQEAWANSEDRIVAREAIRVAGENSRAAVRNAKNQPVRLFAPRRTNETSEVREKILAYLRANCTPDIAPGKGLVGPSRVSEELKVSKGYASRIINEYAADEYPWRTRAMIEAAQQALAEETPLPVEIPVSENAAQ